MANLALKTIIFPFLLFLSMTIAQTTAKLDANYYDRTCPQAEKIIAQAVLNASKRDPKAPARLLRMFFHDCFIKGCDASILLNSTATNQAEKDGSPNISVRAYYVIDEAKAELEKACPRTVSCADIIAITARDVVTMTGGPYWKVLKGRKDGRISRASETLNLPRPSFNVSQLIQSFASRGLNIKDLVALSGGHTLGFSHCSSFESRLRDFSATNDIDPSMNINFANMLRRKCPKPNKNRNAGQFLDSTASIFDNDYYKRLVAGQGVFGSDQGLFGDYRTKFWVQAFARYERLFFKEFVDSMVKLGNVGVKEYGEVRADCRVVN